MYILKVYLETLISNRMDQICVIFQNFCHLWTSVQPFRQINKVVLLEDNSADILFQKNNTIPIIKSKLLSNLRNIILKINLLIVNYLLH